MCIRVGMTVVVYVFCVVFELCMIVVCVDCVCVFARMTCGWCVYVLCVCLMRFYVCVCVCVQCVYEFVCVICMYLHCCTWLYDVSMRLLYV